MNTSTKQTENLAECVNKSKPLLANRFNIDFFQFSFLVQVCIPPSTIVKELFWDDLINKHYHVLTENERQKLFELINRCDNFTNNLPTNEDCQLFNARFDKENQYNVITKFRDGILTSNSCFQWNNNYHISKTQSIFKKYIVEVIKVT